MPDIQGGRIYQAMTNVDSRDEIRLYEKLGFSLGVFGQNVIYGFMTTYLLVFYTDVFGISAAAAGTLFLMARLWDAINDPMMGMIADRTRTKWGKFRPYMLWVPALIAISTVVTFTVPDLSYSFKLVYAYATYISWGMVYTLGDIPMWALASVITRNTRQRTGIITMARVFSIVGIALPTILTVPLLKLFGEENSSSSYRGVAALYGIACVVLMTGIFFTTKERVAPSKKKANLKENMQVIIKNKPLLLIILSSVITNSIVAFRQSILVFYATYNLNNVEMVPLLMGICLITMFIGMIMVPVIVKKIGKKMTFIGYGIGMTLSSLAFYITGYENVNSIILWTAITGIFAGAPSVLESAMLADTIEYAEWKLGIRGEGMVFSTQTFMAKLASALSGGLAGLILTIIGYVPNAMQTQKTLNGLHSMITIIPAIAVFAGIIPILFYELTEEKHEEIVSQLKEMQIEEEKTSQQDVIK